MSNQKLNTVLQSIDSMPIEEQKLIYEHIATKLATEDLKEVAFKQRLLEAGLVQAIRPPVKDIEPYRKRRMATVVGKPVSETVIEERR